MNLGDAIARIRADASDFTAGIANAKAQVSDFVANTSEQIKSIGSDFSEAGKNVTLLTAPITAGAAIALGSFGELDQAMSILRKGGAESQDEFNGLLQVFDNIHTKVPESASSIAQAISDVHNQFGLTGQGLEDFTNKMIKFARVNDADLVTSVSSQSKLFQSLNIDVSKYPQILDEMTLASQRTGIDVNQLTDTISASGATLRTFGFDTEHQIALFSKLTQVGADPQTVIMSLNIALKNLADNGVTDATSALSGIIDEIKNAPDVMKATSIAVDTFGGRAGPKLALMIRQGRFELDDFVGSLKNSTGTVEDTADKSQTFGEQLAILENQVEELLQPVGKDMVEIFRNDLLPLLQQLITLVKQVIDWFQSLDPNTQKVILVILGLAAVLGPILLIIGTIITSIGGLVGALSTIGPVLLPLIAIIAAVIAIVVALKAAWDNNFLGIRDTVTNLWNNVVLPFFQWLGPFIKDTWETKIRPALEKFIQVLQALGAGLSFIWNTIIQPVLKLILTIFEAVFVAVAAVIINNIRQAWNFLQPIFSAIYNAVAKPIGDILNFLLKIGGQIVDALVGPFRQAKQFIDGITSGIQDFINRINPFARHSPSLVDNVRNGVAVIKDLYGSLSSISLPNVSNLGGQLNMALSGNGGPAGGINIDLRGSSISSPEDAAKYAEIIGDALVDKLTLTNRPYGR